MKADPATIPFGVGWLVGKLVARQQKRQTVTDANTIDNLERLHHLKEKGILTEKAFIELREKMKERI